MNKIKVFSTKSVKSLPLHQKIIDKILSLPVKINYMTAKTEYILNKLGKDDECYSKITNKKIVLVIREYKTNGVSFSNYSAFRDNFGLTLLQELKLIKNKKITIQNADAYGTVFWFNNHNDLCGILNNYDSNFLSDYGTDYNENNYLEFVNVLGFATIFNNVIRFTQIVYSLKYQRLIVRDDVCYELPFNISLYDFGGKRAVYRNHSVLSLRTCLEVYDKVDKQYHQSDKLKDTLSYPRLLLF